MIAGVSADSPLVFQREQDERERVGWFPLNRRSSRLMHLAAGDKITGSIKLRVRWVQSIKSFLHCRVQGLEVGRARFFVDMVASSTFEKNHSLPACLHVVFAGLCCKCHVTGFSLFFFCRLVLIARS